VRRVASRPRADRPERLWNDNQESLKSAIWGRESLFGYALAQQHRRRRDWPRTLARYPVVRLRTQAEVEHWLAGVLR
jgi:hypothetical protein